MIYWLNVKLLPIKKTKNYILLKLLHILSMSFNQLNEKIIKINSNSLDVLQEDKKRPLFNRIFGKIGSGSLRASVLNLSILSIGIGTLTIPKKFEQFSLLFCVFVIIISGIATFITLNFLITAGKDEKLTDFSQVVRHYCGKGWGLFLDVTVVVYLTGTNILFQIISK